MGGWGVAGVHGCSTSFFLTQPATCGVFKSAAHRHIGNTSKFPQPQKGNDNKEEGRVKIWMKQRHGEAVGTRWGGREVRGVLVFDSWRAAGLAVSVAVVATPCSLCSCCKNLEVFVNPLLQCFLLAARGGAPPTLPWGMVHHLWGRHSVTGSAGSASSGSCSSLTWTGLRARLCGWAELPSEPSGLAGLWPEQHRRPSREEGTSAPASCSGQKELGQKSQREVAGAPHTLQSCHGHSQRPAHREQQSEKEQSVLFRVWLGVDYSYNIYNICGLTRSSD